MRTIGVFYALAGLFALCAPLLGIYPVFMMQLLCFAMFACAYNLLLGFGRMLSFGHAAFFGSAAYTTAWLVTSHHWGPAAALRRCSPGQHQRRPGGRGRRLVHRATVAGDERHPRAGGRQRYVLVAFLS